MMILFDRFGNRLGLKHVKRRNKHLEYAEKSKNKNIEISHADWNAKTSITASHNVTKER